MIRKVLIGVGCFLAGVASFLLLYFVAEWGCSRIVVPAEKGAPQEMSIYIKTNGMHTDIVVPVRNKVVDWSLQIPFHNNISKDTSYSFLGMGWGDRGFFLDMPTWDDITFSLAFRAAFWLNSTAVHTTYYKELVEDESCRRIEISYKQYERLVAFIAKRFKTDDLGNYLCIPTNAQYGETDAFYQAHGRYNLFYSCNTWSNSALAACGQRHCLWTITDKGMFRIYR
jgi:uncharacterized protein (TIGR02117 family)